MSDLKFTDDDLKRLKEMIVFHKAKMHRETTLNEEDLDGLLARLDAAERICNWAKGISPKDWDDQWQRSKGEKA